MGIYARKFMRFCENFCEVLLEILVGFVRKTVRFCEKSVDTGWEMTYNGGIPNPG